MLKEYLRRSRRGLQDQWANGVFEGETKDQVAILSAGARGELIAYRRILELDYQQISDILEDNQDVED
jgi:hypothetical protein